MDVSKRKIRGNRVQMMLEVSKEDALAIQKQYLKAFSGNPVSFSRWAASLLRGTEK